MKMSRLNATWKGHASPAFSILVSPFFVVIWCPYKIFAYKSSWMRQSCFKIIIIHKYIYIYIYIYVHIYMYIYIYLHIMMSIVYVFNHIPPPNSSPWSNRDGCLDYRLGTPDSCRCRTTPSIQDLDDHWCPILQPGYKSYIFNVSWLVNKTKPLGVCYKTRRMPIGQLLALEKGGRNRRLGFKKGERGGCFAKIKSIPQVTKAFMKKKLIPNERRSWFLKGSV